MGRGVVRVEGYGPARGSDSAGVLRFGFAPVKPPEGQANCQPCMRLGKIRVDLDRSFEKRLGLSVILRRLGREPSPARKEIVCFEIGSPADGRSRRQGQ